MSHKLDKFKAWFERLPSGEHLRAFTKSEAETWLSARLEESGGKDIALLEQLLNLYIRSHETDKATRCIQRLMDLVDDRRAVSCLFLRLGQIAEQINDYSSAEKFYRDSLALGPPDEDVAYWVNNNLGYCLNVLGRPAEAEAYLKRAVELLPTRSNAFKNLALCYQSLGRPVEAVEQFIAATHANAADPRSLALLEKMLEEQPELFGMVSDLHARLANCRMAVAQAQMMEPDFDGQWQKLREKQEREKGDQA